MVNEKKTTKNNNKNKKKEMEQQYLFLKYVIKFPETRIFL